MDDSDATLGGSETKIRSLSNGDESITNLYLYQWKTLSFFMLCQCSPYQTVTGKIYRPK